MLRSKTAFFSVILASIYAAFLVGLYVFNFAVVPTDEGIGTMLGNLIVAEIENWVLIYHLGAVIFGICFLWSAYNSNNHLLVLLSTIAFVVAALFSFREYNQIVSYALVFLSAISFFTIERAKLLNTERQRHKEERAVRRHEAAAGRSATRRPVDTPEYDVSLDDLALDAPAKPQKPQNGVPYPLQITLYVLYTVLAAAALIVWGPVAFRAFFAWLDAILVTLGG